jgi:hypothetical protein
MKQKLKDDTSAHSPTYNERAKSMCLIEVKIEQMKLHDVHIATLAHT